ncbi:MAG: hypothetical protein JNM40_22575 [Myxococcales bacterium]|nr:hypothetical protein [Myxococcales bacterium]
MQVCSQCSHTVSSAPSRVSGERRHCPHCNAELPTEDVPLELFDLPVPLRPPSGQFKAQTDEDILPVPLRPVPDYRKERQKSTPPHAPQLHVVMANEEPVITPPRPLQQPIAMLTLSIGPTQNPPPSAAQITMPEQPIGSKSPSAPPQAVSVAVAPTPSDGARADRSTTSAKPIVLPMEPPRERSESKPVIERPTPVTSASSAQPSPSPGDPAQLGRLAARAGSTQSAKPVSTTGRSPTPSSQNSANSQPGDMPLSAMFSMAASRQSLASQTPQALKLGWLIAGLALAALLLLLTILVLVERSRDRDAGPPLLPPSASMQ